MREMRAQTWCGKGPQVEISNDDILGMTCLHVDPISKEVRIKPDEGPARRHPWWSYLTKYDPGPLRMMPVMEAMATIDVGVPPDSVPNPGRKKEAEELIREARLTVTHKERGSQEDAGHHTRPVIGDGLKLKELQRIADEGGAMSSSEAKRVRAFREDPNYEPNPGSKRRVPADKEETLYRGGETDFRHTRAQVSVTREPVTILTIIQAGELRHINSKRKQRGEGPMTEKGL
jgi:hypothetical protein